jgi:hypothetical protein
MGRCLATDGYVTAEFAPDRWCYVGLGDGAPLLIVALELPRRIPVQRQGLAAVPAQGWRQAGLSVASRLRRTYDFGASFLATAVATGFSGRKSTPLRQSTPLPRQ